MLDGQKGREEIGGKSSGKWSLERTAPGPCRPQPWTWIALKQPELGQELGSWLCMAGAGENNVCYTMSVLKFFYIIRKF